MKATKVVPTILLSCSLAATVHAGSLSFQTSAPTPGPLDIYSFTAGATDGDNVGGGNDAATYVAFDRGAQGQTFLTGNTPSVLNAIWVQWVSYDGTYVYLPPGGVFHARFTDPAAAGTPGFVLQSDSFTTTGTEPDTLPTTFMGPITGNGTWLRFELETPMLMGPNGTYGFDISSPGPAAGFGGFDSQPFFETAGTSMDVYAGGQAYTSGPNGSGGDDTMTANGGDHVFLLEITGVPEPSTFALGGLGLALLAVFRRRR